MIADTSLRKNVQDELDWDSRFDANHIGVISADGVITLTGYVGSYVEREAVIAAVRRVHGVKAIAQEIDIRPPHEKRVADDEIAHRVIKILSWDCLLPKGDIDIRVENGIVFLSGEVDWQYQREDAENAVRRLGGIRGIQNNITLKRKIAAADIRQKIERALARSADCHMEDVKISVDGTRCILDGTVATSKIRQSIEDAAWSAPGIVRVINRLAVKGDSSGQFVGLL